MLSLHKLTTTPTKKAERNMPLKYPKSAFLIQLAVSFFLYAIVESALHFEVLFRKISVQNSTTERG